MSKKRTKTLTRIAEDAARRGDHHESARLFAELGIEYVPGRGDCQATPIRWDSP